MELAYRPPLRLDYTVAALQRVAANPVDVWADGRYLRLVGRSRRAASVLELREVEGRLELNGSHGDAALVTRMLGLDVDLAGLAARVRTPALRALVRRFEGMKPPRFASLWETFLNTVSFQQLSLAAGMAAVRKLVLGLTPAVRRGDVELHRFPTAEEVADLDLARMRSFGFSGAKARSLLALARLVADGELVEATFERLPTEEAKRELCELPGIGPWTADLVLLRGMRRLDVFPGGDAGAARGLERFLPGLAPPELFDELGPFRGMLYFDLLLAGRYGAA